MSQNDMSGVDLLNKTFALDITQVFDDSTNKPIKIYKEPE